MPDKEIGSASSPVTPMQAGMVFESCYAPGSGVNIEQIVCELAEAWCPERVREAWQSVVDRHPALRLSLPTGVDGERTQRVHGHVEVGLRIEDWSASSDAQAVDALAAYLNADRHVDFDPGIAPMMRLAWFRRGADRSILVWTYHHAVLDGRAAAVVLRQVLERCAGLATPAPCPDAPQLDRVPAAQETTGEAARDFWRGQLQGVVAGRPVTMPVSPAVGHDVVWRELGDDALSEVDRARAALGIGFSTVLLGAWSLVLSRFSGRDDVVFGWLCQVPGLAPHAQAVGQHTNTLPIRLEIDAEQGIGHWLRDLRRLQDRVRHHAGLSLADIQRDSGVPAGANLIDSVVVADRRTLNDELHAADDRWKASTFHHWHQTGVSLTVYGYALGGRVAVEFDGARVSREDAARLADDLIATMRQIAAAPAMTLATVTGPTLHGLVQAQVSRSPARVAVACGKQRLTYAELDERVSRVAARLHEHGLRPGGLVAVLLDRSMNVPVALLGVLRAGGAYVPLDSSYPNGRLSEILSDAQPYGIVAEDSLIDRLPAGSAPVWTLADLTADLPTGASVTPCQSAISHLAYVMYTSGSTGRPKGVMVTHRNVVSLCAAMEKLLGDTGAEVWLSGTSVAFDISVVELLWPLTRGGTVVIERPETLADGFPPVVMDGPARALEFSLSYFAADADRRPRDRYRLLVEGARFADGADFAAVWMPERHFHPFGGLFPNPSVTAAALATVTRRVKLRAGSIVLALHDPLRVVEEWSVVDNLSGGRVGLGFASGWSATDFALAPHAFEGRTRELLRRIETVQRLWQGDTVQRESGDGRDVDVRAYPAAVQRDVPCWLTVSRSEEAFQAAGQRGLGVLTNLIGLSLDELADRVRIYRNARRSAGHPGDGHVTLMIHTFVNEDAGRLRDVVHAPLCAYLESAVDLIGQAQPTHLADVSPVDRAQLVESAFEKYFTTHGLFGTPDGCLDRIRELQAAGVDEIACLIDFGLPDDTVLEGLPHLARLQQLHRDSGGAPISHFQCTPSRLRMLLADPGGRRLLASLRYLLVGGERFPADLVADVCALVPGTVLNMYGPTETTIWSTAGRVTPEGPVTIGRPLANTELLIMDSPDHVMLSGEAGEICIAGDGVAAGYWNDAAATAARFVPHPFHPGTLYRTGDLGRYGPDGRLEFLGRVDDQVKILGHRVELAEIEAKLTEHAEVRHAAVRLVDREHGPQLVAYIEPRSDPGQQAVEARLLAWRQVWDAVHGAAPRESRYPGWTSACTRDAMDPHEVEQAYGATVERLANVGTRHVLEIGCGDGQICRRLAARCERYQAWDVAPTAVERCRDTLRQAGLLDRVQTRVADGRQLADVPPQSLDLVILNSTIQYFPDAADLEHVLGLAVQAVRPGGHVFVGDVRNLRLHEAWAVDVEETRGPATREADDIWRAARRRCDEDPELLVAPEFFTRLQSALPRLSGVDVQLQRGESANELNRFRYDVILFVEHADLCSVEAPVVEWRDRRMSPDGLRAMLVSDRPACLRLAGVPNRRVARLLRRIDDLQGIPPDDDAEGYGPEDWWRMSRTINYRVAVTWTPFDRAGRFDVICVRSDLTTVLVPPCDPSRTVDQSGENFTNRPGVPRAALEWQLRQHLADRLPEWMRPAQYVFLDALPRTVGGKLARHELPVPAPAAASSLERDRAEWTPVERFLAREWRALLGVDHIGLDDSFFAVGGHSLLAVQLVVRLGRSLASDVPLRALFEARTIRNMAAWLVRHEAQKGLVERRVVQVEGDGDGTGEDASAPVPLTIAQRRIWFMEQLEPGRGTYHVARAARVHGWLDHDALRRACEAVARRHDALRAQVVLVAGVPHQRFPDWDAIPFELADLTDVPEGLRTAAADRRVQEATRRLFDLGSDRLWRLVVIRVGETQSTVVAVMHHLVCDGYSMEIFFRDLFDMYAVAVGGGPLPSGPRFRLRTHALREHRHEQRGGFTDSIRYWREHLSGAPPLLDLPRDAPRSVARPAGTERVMDELPADLRADLQRIASRHDATVSTVMLAAFATLLQRLCGQDDLVLGCPVAGRTGPDAQDVIGCFVNPLPLRLRRTQETAFHEWLVTVREVLFAGLANQDCPFDTLVHGLEVERHPDRSPVFQVMFNHLTFPDTSRSIAGIRTEPLGYAELSGKYDLTMYVFEGESSTSVELAYAADLFGRQRVREMLSQYVTLLRQIVTDPELPLNRYTLVTPTSRAQLPDPRAPLRREWHGAAIEHFDAQCARHPDAVAIVAAEETSYRSLDRAVNRLARRLLDSGVRRADVVAISADRCPALVVAMLAVHRIAAAFMILDAGHPAPRASAQLRKVRPSAWIRCGPSAALPDDLADTLSDLPLACRLDGLGATMSTLEQSLASSSDAPLTREVSPDDLAYVAFTSGSTGTPLAVSCNHRALSHYLNWHTSRFEIGPHDRVTMLSGLSHDPLLRDVLAPLWAGAAICIPDSTHRLGYLDPLWLRDWFRRTKVSVTHLTPGIGRILTAGAGGDETATLDRLRLVFFAGEPMTGADTATMWGIAPAATCINLYGTTETQQATGGHFVCPRDSTGSAVLPLGRGIADVQLLVVNDEGLMAGVGELGDIYIRTPYMADGYLDEPELTAGKFVVNPVTRTAGDRALRTGDRGRYRPDGAVEFCGRSDRQVKVQGCRIEPEEIEAVIRVVPGVRGCVVSATDGAAGGTELVAHIVTDPEVADIVAARVRSAARVSLPGWMCPRHVVTMDELPLTENGKVDRARLPSRGSGAQFGGAPPVAEHASGRDDLDEKLAGIWRRVLGVESVGPDDDFFALGGSSLEVVELLHEIQQGIGLAVALADFYREPTFRRLARALREPGAVPGSSRLVRLSGEGPRPALYFVHAPEVDLPLFASLAVRLPRSQPTFYLRTDREGLTRSHAETRAMAVSIAADLRRFQPRGPYCVAGYSFGGVVAFEVGAQLARSVDDPVTVVLFDSHIPPYGPVRLRGPRWRTKNLVRHVETLTRLGPRAARRYIGERVGLYLGVVRGRFRPRAAPYPLSPFHGRLLLFRADDQEYVESRHEPANGWDRFSHGPLEVVGVLGRHTEVLREPALSMVAERLGRLLQENPTAR